MKDVPRLHTLWTSLVGADLLELRSGKATVSEEHGITDGFSDEARLAGFNSITRSVLHSSETSLCERSIVGMAAWEATRQLLLGACQPQTLPASLLDFDELEDVPAEIADGLPVARLATETVKELSAYGILDIDQYIQVPRHLIGLIAEVCAEPLWDEDGLVLEIPLPGNDENYARLGASTASGAPLAPNGSRVPDAPPVPEATYQLKIMLKDSKPPIWRRIMVSSCISLADLHEIIAAAFDWDNSHLHLFEEPGRHGMKYSSEPVEPTPWEDSHEDEFDAMLVSRA